MGDIRVCWTVPRGETLSSEVFPSFLQIAAHGFPFIDFGFRRKDICLNMLGRYLLDSEFTHAVVLDADHMHPHDVIEQLCYWPGRDPTKLVVGGLNYRRGEPYEPMAYIRDKQGHSYSLTANEPGLYRVSVIGGGSMLYAREAFERLPYPWFQCVYDSTTETPGEDTYFSALCEKHGVEMWCDAGVTSPHLGTKWIDRWAFEDFLAATPDWNTPVMNEDEEAAFIKANLPDLFRAKSVLYVGASRRCRHADAFRRHGAHMTLLEIFERNVETYRRRGAPFGEVLQADVRTWEPAGHYDVAFWWHGPEHVSKEDLPRALGNLEAVADLVVTGCPWGTFPQRPVYHNPAEEHKSMLGPEDFGELGYDTATVGEKDAGRNCCLAWKHCRQ